jgi:hypothetical protein
MAIKAIVSFNQKLGQPNYGSVGVGCSVEVELDSALLEKDPQELRGKLDLAYITCRQSVQSQLIPFQASESAPSRTLTHADAISERPSRPATQSQQRALWAICNQNGLNLEAVCRDEYEVPAADCLSISQASSLIDKLKSTTSVAGGAR